MRYASKEVLGHEAQITYDPRVLVVELDGTDVVEVPEEGEQTAPKLVVPNFDLVVVTPGHNQRLDFVKVHSPNGTVMLIEPLQEDAHAAVTYSHTRISVQ
jgi:hypothetical protein